MAAPTNITDWVRGTKRHTFYKESVDHYTNILYHSDGIYPEKLIKDRRPGESETIQKFRQQIYVCKTEAPFSKVLNSLMKIRKASDFNPARFDSAKVPAIIAPEETPEEYTAKYFPKYKSFDNWFWSVCFKQMVVDPNAISLVGLLNPVRSDSEYAKPYPVIYNSPQILDYEEGKYYFLESKEAATYTSGNRSYPAKVFVYVDTEVIAKYTQSNARGDYNIDELTHNLGYLSVVKLNGTSVRDNATNTLYKSRLSPMLPELNEAVREYTDLQAGIVQYMFPQYWYYGAMECGTCQGTGKIPKDDGSVNCVKCDGRGKFPFSPFQNWEVKAPSATDPAQAPTPPAAPIERDTKIVELQDRRIQEHIYYALSAVDMEYLATQPLNQSGLAKEWDRSNTNNFVYGFAEDAVRVMDEHHDIFNDYRYKLIVPNDEIRSELSPRIEVPVQYDLVTDAMMTQEISRMKDAKFNQRIIAAAEIEFVGRKFITNDALRDSVIAECNLDPLSGRSEEDITMQLSNNGISKKDYVIHCNIKGFLERAMLEDPTFLSLDEKSQREKIDAMATEFLAKNDTTNQVVNSLAPAVPPMDTVPTDATANN